MRMIALLVLAGFLVADEFHLADGRVLEGEIVSAPTAPRLAIRTASGGMTAIIEVDPAQVVRHVAGPTPRQRALMALAVRRQDLGAAGSAAEWWSLVDQYRAQGEAVEARACARMVLERDADHAPARSFLGFVRQDGVWMRPEEAAVARGEVLFRGAWMPAAQRDAVLAEEARLQAEADAQRARRQEQELQALALRRERARTAAAEASSAVPGPAFTFGTYQTVPSILLRDPARWAVVPVGVCAPVTPPPPTVQVQAAGKTDGVSWKLHYAK